MLFQTHYSLDPYDDFEPHLANCCNVDITDKGRESGLQIRYQPPQTEDEKSRLIVFLTKHVRVVPDEVLRIFQGDRGSDGQLAEKRLDGFQNYPSSYRSFILDLHREMDGIASDIFNTLRWRLGIEGGPLRLISIPGSMRWYHDASRAADDEHGFLNRQIPLGVIELTFPESQEWTFSQTHRRAVEELLAKEAVEPLHHDLFREAWQNQRSNPRSALVIGIAALETALKTAICELHEPLRWVLENLPSPPVDKLLREYLPQLSARKNLSGKGQRAPAGVITIVKKGIEQRNRLVHGREEIIAQTEVRNLLECVRDVLYLLDYYRGHDWAIERVRHEFVDQLRDG